jgi:hypothetical protein
MGLVIKWTEEEDSILRRSCNLTIAEITPLLPGRSETAIRQRARFVGIRFKRKPTFTYEFKKTSQQQDTDIQDREPATSAFLAKLELEDPEWPAFRDDPRNDDEDDGAWKAWRCDVNRLNENYDFHEAYERQLKHVERVIGNFNRFVCARRSTEITEHTCSVDFSKAHLFNKRDDVCYLCPRGAAKQLQSILPYVPNADTIARLLIHYSGNSITLGKMRIKVKEETWWRK